MMKRLAFFAVIALAWTACGNKTNSSATDADSTQVFEVPDTLNTVEAVVKQVNAVYDRWNAMRENYKEGMPSLDDIFGTKEWRQMVEKADSVTKECECGGFFHFGDEGPLDPWTYDCYEGRVSADSIKVEILPNGEAEVKFLVKDAVTIKGIPMRWLMRVEDGEWRVANIFFVANENMDLLQGMKEYVWENKTNQQFDIKKYYGEFVEMAEPLFAGYDPVEFYEYALIDVDRDGKPELYMRNGKAEYEVVFSLDDKDPHILIDADYHRSISFFKDAIQSSGGCGTGCHMAEVVVLKDSKRLYTLNNMEQYDMEGELAEEGWEKDGKEIPTQEGDKLYKKLGEPIDHYINWHSIDIERKPNLSDYAE